MNNPNPHSLFYSAVNTDEPNGKRPQPPLTTREYYLIDDEVRYMEDTLEVEVECVNEASERDMRDTVAALRKLIDWYARGEWK